MTREREQVFIRELRVTIPFETYQDPEREAEHRTRGAVATSSAYLCEHLFWAVQHLAFYGKETMLAAVPDDFFETLQAIGLVGRAVAVAVSEEAQALERIAEQRLQKQKADGRAK